MSVTIVGQRVFTCDICGAEFRFKQSRTIHPPGQWPPATCGTVVDEAEDTAMREHTITHGGTLDRQLAYCGPTTFSTHVEEVEE